MDKEIVRLDFEFESGGRNSVDIDRDLLVQTYPKSFFDLLFSGRWAPSESYHIFVPNIVVEFHVDCLKFRKNFVPLLLNDNVCPTIAIKLEKFIDCYLASTIFPTKEIIQSFISNRVTPFQTLKQSVITLNWLFDNGLIKIIENNFDKWQCHLAKMRKHFLTKELYHKYLLFFTINLAKTKKNKVVNPFQFLKESEEVLVDLLQYKPSLFPLLVKNSKCVGGVEGVDNFAKIVPSLCHFEENLKKLCPFYDKLPWSSGICVAGGSVLNCLTNNFYQTRDVDIFVYNSDSLLSINDSSNPSIFFKVIDIIVKWAKSENKETFFVDEKGVINIVVKDWFYSFQVIPICAENPVDIIKKFDSDINQSYYDGNQIMCTESFLNAISTNTIHHFDTFKNYRLYRFLEKGFSVANTINIWTKYHMHFCHSDDFETTLNHVDVMGSILKDKYDSDHIKKHYDQDLVFQSDDIILATLTDCYKFSSSVTKDLQTIINSNNFNNTIASVYIQSSPAFVELTDGIQTKMIKSNKKWFVRDKDGNDIIFLFKGVKVSSHRFGKDRYTISLGNDPSLLELIKAFEKVIYKSIATNLPFKSLIFQDRISFKIHVGTRSFGNITEGGIANVLINPHSVRKFRDPYNPFVYLTLSAQMIRWLT